MKDENEIVEQMLTELPLAPLPSSLRERTLARAHGQLAPPPGAARPSLARALPSYATSAVLLSAAVVFVADTVPRISRVFGG
ncbi:MAG: hypothetical protein JXP73_00195 [Deltaproteobacteria bacterium]|nr:hypothetical protein [Deltaproteobacteria bacterium]